jgi:hypothetical protein
MRRKKLKPNGGSLDLPPRVCQARPWVAVEDCKAAMDGVVVGLAESTVIDLQAARLVGIWEAAPSARTEEDSTRSLAEVVLAEHLNLQGPLLEVSRASFPNSRGTELGISSLAVAPLKNAHSSKKRR